MGRGNGNGNNGNGNGRCQRPCCQRWGQIAASRAASRLMLTTVMLLFCLGGMPGPGGLSVAQSSATAAAPSPAQLPDACKPPVPQTNLEPLFVPAKADIIWVVDTSGSMTDEAAYLTSNLMAFGNYLNNSGIDYRLAVVGKSHGNVQLCVDPPLAYESCGIRGERFAQFPKFVNSHDALLSLINTYDNINNLVSAADSADLSPYTGWGSFAREDASTVFVVVTDDDSRYRNLAAGQVRGDGWTADLIAADTLSRITPTAALPKGFAFHSIYHHDCPNPSGTQWLGTGESWTYKYLSQVANGTTFKICESDWTSYFQTIAGDVEQVAVVSCAHAVPTVPGVEVGEPFQILYNAERASMSFAASAAPSNTCPSQAGTDHLYSVDDVANPTTATLCETACNALRGSRGNMSFVFTPTPVMKAFTVTSRDPDEAGPLASADSFVPISRFPAQHPALTSNTCETIDATQRIRAEMQNMYDNCAQAPGVSMLYALNLTSGDSDSGFAEEGAMTIFMAVDSAGSSWIGVQIASSSAAQASADVSVRVVQTAPIPAQGIQWVVQDGTNSDFSVWNGQRGLGVASLAAPAGGNTAGGMLGPFPNTDVCIQLQVMETNHISRFEVLNFSHAPASGVNGLSRVDIGSSLAVGGADFCAVRCTGQQVRNGCYLTTEGLVCPSTDPTPSASTPAPGPMSVGNNPGGDQTGQQGDQGGQLDQDEDQDEDQDQDAAAAGGNGDGNGAGVVIGAAVGGVVGCILIVIAGLFFIRRRSSSGSTGGGPSWTRKRADTGEIYHEEEQTGEQTWSNPMVSDIELPELGEHVHGSADVWTSYVDESGHTAYYNTVTGETSWEGPVATSTPSPLPVHSRHPSSPWVEFTTEEGHTAYYNTASGETSWVAPKQEPMHRKMTKTELKRATISLKATESTWVEFTTEDGHTAYYNTEDGDTSWTPPTTVPVSHRAMTRTEMKRATMNLKAIPKM